jgi:CRISPR-associated protein Cas1
MIRKTTSLATPVAHLVGPGKVKVINGHLAFAPVEGQTIRLDPERLRTLACYGGVSVSDLAMELLLRHAVGVACLTPAGHHCHGRLVSSQDQGTILRLAQCRLHDAPAARLRVARDLVRAKIDTQLAAVRHFQRHGAPHAGLVLGRLSVAGTQCASAASLDSLRGVEGSASAAWFGFFGTLLKAPWRFEKRVRRPPTDPINALLSLGYTWLTTRATARCQADGLETALGCLHDYRPGRPSLACDLIEPLRVPVVDRWVLAICNEGRIAPADFRALPQGAVYLQRESFGKVLLLWEEHWSNTRADGLLDEQVNQRIKAIRACSETCAEKSTDDEGGWADL